MTQQLPPVDGQPDPPSLGNFQTILTGAQRLAIRHPAELPWLAIGVLLFILNYIGVIAVLTSMIVTGEDLSDGNDVVVQLILLALLLPILIYYARAIMYAQMRVRSVRMSPTQFPEAYRMVCEAAYLHGLRRVPDAYVVLGNGQINAFASGHGYRRFVAVYSDLFEVGGAARDPDALRFIIGHEVGHIAAGHTSYFRLLVTSTIRQIPVLSGFLSRSQEYTADNFGYRYWPQGSAGAMRVLAAGKYLNVNVDSNEFADRATIERGIWVWLANLLQTHPVLIWRTQALRDRSRPGAILFAPKFTPAATPTLPSGGEPTANWPTPGEALAFLDRFPPPGPPQFGANFPVPLPGDEHARPSGYGATPQLRRGWAQEPSPEATNPPFRTNPPFS